MIIVPLHPRTAKLIRQLEIKPNFKIIEPIGYFDMLQLLHHCSIVITDSGGLQKEAYFFKKFSVVLREQTEWVELLNNGFVSLWEVIQKKLLILHISCCKLHLLIKQIYTAMAQQEKES